MRTYHFAIICLLLINSILSASTEKLDNGEFDNGLSPWQVNNWSGGTGIITNSIDTTGKISGSNSVKLSIVQNTDETWKLHMRQLFSVTQGAYYEVSYYAVADRECEIQILLQNSDTPYETFIYPVQTIGTEPLRFTASGVANFTGQGQLMFALGKTDSGTTIWIDNVSVTEELPPSGTVTITIDFNQPQDVSSTSGFLLGLDVLDPVNGPPEQILIDALEPAYWRVRPETSWVSRAILSGATPICILSEGWYPGEPLTNPITPWQDNYIAWEAHVRAKAQTFGTNVVYDIWNEPDYKAFLTNWPDATFDKFLETFKHAHDVIRDELGTSAIISGPSLSESISPWKLRRFMDYCRDNNLLIQAISVHMLDRQDCELGLMETDMLQLRTDYIDNPAYAAVGAEQIHVNEYASWGLQSYRPGSLLAFLHSMETAQVDAACKACWPHPDCADCSTCWDGSIDGILTETSLQPRAGWWAYRWYSNSAVSRVKAESNDWSVCPIASLYSEKPNSTQILLASNARWAEPVNQTTVNVSLQNIQAIPFMNPDINRLAVTVERLNYTDATAAQALNSPEMVERFIIDVIDGEANFSVSNLMPYEVQRILIYDHSGLHLMLKALSQNWLNSCNLPNWCEHSDLDYSKLVDFIDFAFFAQIWLGE